MDSSDFHAVSGRYAAGRAPGRNRVLEPHPLWGKALRLLLATVAASGRRASRGRSLKSGRVQRGSRRCRPKKAAVHRDKSTKATRLLGSGLRVVVKEASDCAI